VIRWNADPLEPRVIGFTLLASGISVLAFGLTPALRAIEFELNHAIQGSGNRNTRRLGVPRFLVVAQIAIAMVLAMSSGLLIRSFMRLTAIDPGFRAENRITFDVELPGLLESTALSHRTPTENRQRSLRQALWFAELTRRLESVPGIEAVGASNAFPLTEEEGGWGVEINGKRLPPSTSMAHVSSGYFRAMAAPILAGATFSVATDSIAGSKALIVNQTMARLLFPGGAAVGRHVNAPRCKIDISTDSSPTDCVIVGIAKDTRFSLGSPPPPTFFYSLSQDIGDRITYVVKFNGKSALLMAAIRGEILNMPPINSRRAYVFHLQTVSELMAQSVAMPRFRSWLVGLFAFVAIVLATTCIYSMQAYAVSQRMREIGIRIALGARPTAVFSMILRDAARWAFVGVGVGLAASAAVARLMAAFLFGVSGWDAETIALSSLALLGAALVSSYFPARRAMCVDPMVALRSE
jgi:predicted permease